MSSIKVNKKTGVIKHTMTAYGEYYTGTAKVNEKDGDVFNYDLGCRIAYLRAIIAMKQDKIDQLREVKQLINEEGTRYQQSAVVPGLDEKIKDLEEGIKRLKAAIEKTIEKGVEK